MATEITTVKVNKTLLKQASVKYAKVENDLATQIVVTEKALKFFRDHYGNPVAEAKKR